jgi:hypothetical protein
MESMPFPEKVFGAVVSQFGFEYSELDAAAREMARVVEPGAKLSFLVHHADSAIVATNRVRLAVLTGFLAPAMRGAFCNGDAAAFLGQMSTLASRQAGDALVAELARTLPSRLGRAPRERAALWKALEEALAPELCLAQSLQACCVAPARIEAWLQPLNSVASLRSVAVLSEPDGTPIAWRVEGVVQPGGPR